MELVNEVMKLAVAKSAAEFTSSYPVCLEYL
jgi:hypothetical protein